MKKKKILLLQIPDRILPNLNDWGKTHSVSSAPTGYIKAFADYFGYDSKLEFELFPLFLSDLAGCGYILEKIREYSPDVLWLPYISETNALRSMYFCEKIKEENPGILAVGNSMLIPSFSKVPRYFNPLDVGIFARGDDTLESILQFLSGNNPLENIEGIIIKDGNKFKINRCSKNSILIKDIPSHYFQGITDPLPEKDTIIMETKRECPNSCNYCYSGGTKYTPESFLPLSRIEKELCFFRDNGVKFINFMDPLFNEPKEWFYKVCNLIKTVNKNRELTFRFNLRLDLLSPEDIEILCDCNTGRVEAGLETLNEEVLKNIDRKVNIKRFIENLRALRERGIKCDIHLITGLPGEDLCSYKKGIDILIEEGLFKDIIFFPLQVLPSTNIYKNNLQISAQKCPPHLILKTPSMTFDEIRESVFYTIEKGGKIGNESYSDSPPLLSYFLLNGDSALFLKNKNRALSPFNKIIIDLDGNPEKYIEKASKNLASSPVIWFKSHEPKKDLHKIKEILKQLSIPNPYNAWNIVIEPSLPFDAKYLNEIEGSIKYSANSLDYEAIYHETNPKKEYYRMSVKFYILLKKGLFKNDFVYDLKKENALIYQIIDIGTGINIDEIMNIKSDGILFEGKINKVYQFLADLKNKNWQKKHLAFADWCLQCIWDNQFLNEELKGLDEKIMIVDKNKTEYISFKKELLK